MKELEIRKLQKGDENDILQVCYRTGFMGEDLRGRGRFNDIRLFGYLFCLYYAWYEPENCFVAEDKTSHKVVGYILGTCDTIRQEIRFGFFMGWRIFLHLILVSSWKYPESFRAFWYFVFNARPGTGIKNFYSRYPAHLHINILPEYQKSGVGTRLIKAFEIHMKAQQVNGIHLHTSNKNYKAFPFYLKHSYAVVHENAGKVWADVLDYKSVIFAKEMESGD